MSSKLRLHTVKKNASAEIFTKLNSCELQKGFIKLSSFSWIMAFEKRKSFVDIQIEIPKLISNVHKMFEASTKLQTVSSEQVLILWQFKVDGSISPTFY